MATFEHFYKTLRSDDKVKWKDFEKFVKWYLKTDPKWMSLVKNIWLWDEHPKREEWGPDNGIDLVFEHINGEIWAVQAKCFGPQNGIRKEHMDSFIAESSDSRFQKRLLVASTNKIGPNVDRLLKRHKVVRILLDDISNSDLDFPNSPTDYRNAKRKDPPTPLPHQEEAISEVLNRLKTSNKGQVLMACGTGKTLTSLWIKERLNVENTLVLLPSLSLLSQTLKEWHKAAKKPFKWICVCSDKSVAKEDNTNDDWIANTSEIGVPVTSSSDEIKKFLSEKGSKVIFSTYQSSPLIVDVQGDENVLPFEIVFADEAHRCAGKVSDAFSSVLDDKKIRSIKKLFFTATPKILSSQIKGIAKSKEIKVASMDEKEIFGEVLFELKFSDAINNDPPLLTDYQVVISIVDNPMIKQQILNRDLLTPDGEKIIDAESLASTVGIINSIKDFNLRRVISFHNKVKNAKIFASNLQDINKIISQKNRPSGIINCEHVSGSMKSSERNQKLKRLKYLNKKERRLLSNARCLSEGVDVPALDGVAFIEPRSSQVDIVQAVGRAIRKSNEKRIGTIVIPVYVDGIENLEEEILASKFADVWKILLALKSQDDSLMETIDNLRISLGTRGGKVGGNGLEKIIIIPERINAKFADSIKTLLVKNTSEDWYERYGELIKFFESSDALSPNQETSLGRWVNWQRYLFKNKKLEDSKIKKLEKIEKWVWDEIDAFWIKMYEELKIFIKDNGHMRISQEFQLGTWIQTQRSNYKKGKLAEEKLNALNDIPEWSWDPFKEKWIERFEELKKFERQNGDARPSQGKTILGNWCNKQRFLYKKGTLGNEYIELLNSINSWTWDLNESDWQRGFNEVKDFIAKYGHMKIHETNRSLATWVTKQRNSYKRGEISDHRKNKLDSLSGWVWDPLKEEWDSKYLEFQNFISTEGHANVPQRHPSLGKWIAKQRQRYKKGLLEKEKITLLEKFDNWKWNILDESWESNYIELNLYISKHKKIPPTNIPIGSWALKQRQRFKKNKLEKDRINKLKKLENWYW